MHRFDFERWLDSWGRAWESLDAEAFVPLLAADVVWLRDPFAVPVTGAEAARESLVEGLAGVREIAYAWEFLGFGDSRGVAHWEATITPREGPPSLFDGVLVGDFDDAGQCRALREWWNRADS